jgi:hypothetical protein
MSLVAHIGGRPAPASSWQRFLPSCRQRTASTPGKKPVIGAKVMAALHAGFDTPAMIAEHTGLTTRQVRMTLHSLAKPGFVRASRKGPGCTWSAT